MNGNEQVTLWFAREAVKLGQLDQAASEASEAGVTPTANTPDRERGRLVAVKHRQCAMHQWKYMAEEYPREWMNDLRHFLRCGYPVIRETNGGE